MGEVSRAEINYTTEPKERSTTDPTLHQPHIRRKDKELSSTELGSTKHSTGWLEAWREGVQLHERARDSDGLTSGTMRT